MSLLSSIMTGITTPRSDEETEKFFFTEVKSYIEGEINPILTILKIHRYISQSDSIPYSSKYYWIILLGHIVSSSIKRDFIQHIVYDCLMWHDEEEPFYVAAQEVLEYWRLT